MTYYELVDQVREAYKNADASFVKEHVAFQFNIQGEGEGAFYLEIADGKINIEPYEYFDRDVLITTTAETLLKIGTGKLDPVFAFTIGKLKAEGNLDKALLLKTLSKKVEVSAEAKAAADAPEKVPEAAEKEAAPAETEQTAPAGTPEETEAAAEEAASAASSDKAQTDATKKWPNRKKKKR